ncbi:hypothetical protein CKA32_006295 [Geitlerinema sp. FC II]|nr:hypothetical protein CKA32_006295 [Geitlerinema sp. FC II]
MQFYRIFWVHLKNVNLYERIRISASNSHIFAKLRCTPFFYILRSPKALVQKWQPRS